MISKSTGKTINRLQLISKLLLCLCWLFVNNSYANGGEKPKRHKIDYEEITIRNRRGMEARFCTNGARIMSIVVPDKNGKRVHVVAGFNTAEEFDTSTQPYYGAIIGRVANRISKGKITLAGKTFELDKNDGQNTLHGGEEGFHYKDWRLTKMGDSSVLFTLISPDGDGGFPGQLYVRIIYTVKSNNSLVIDYESKTEQATYLNLTNHAFFNLNGKGTILKHKLQINAERYTPINQALIPTGKIDSVKGTPLDFNALQEIGSRINSDHQQLKYAKGYDFNYVLDAGIGEVAATAIGDESGIRMRVYTKEPGLQFYSGNFMKGDNLLRSGADHYRTAFCLETQHFPDSPNQPKFPSIVLRPGEIRKSRTIYAFDILKE